MKIPSTFDLVVWGLIAACGVGLLFVVKGWHDDALELPKARAATRQLQDDYDALQAREAENKAQTENHGHAFDQAQADLDAARAADPVPDVRVCVNRVPPASRVTTRGTAQPGDAASTDPGVVPEAARRDPEERAGPNIGPDLFALIDRADDVALIAQQCQAWIRDNP